MDTPARDLKPAWHALSADDVAATLEVSPSQGLSGRQVQERLGRYGPNALPEAKTRSLLAVFGGQFKSPLIYLLFAAAGVALALGHSQDAIVIFVVVLLNAFIGAFQEGRAERSLAALRRLASHKARLVRDGAELIVEAKEVVPGDVLVLEAGDAVAADARVIEAASLQVSEAALTGESVPVPKFVAGVPPETTLPERSDLVFAGTHVTAGRAKALVVATGQESEIGHIARMAETAGISKTPLERRVDQFGKAIIWVALGLFVLVNLIGLLRGLPWAEILMVAISQVVGMIPEGLPVAMTIALAVGVQRMAKRNAVVRRLAAVETLGSTTIICSDKTGTLTRNEMTVTHLEVAGRSIDVSGTGFSPDGRLTEGGRAVEALTDVALRELLEAGVLCNDAKLEPPTNGESAWRPIGDPTEIALVALAHKADLAPDEIRSRLPRKAELPFDPALKLMATQHQTPTGTRVLLKGAPEELLMLCAFERRGGRDEPLSAERRLELEQAVNRLTRRALRVLAIATVEGGIIDGRVGFELFRGKACLLGLVGQIDPPRIEVKDAVARCLAAGVRPVMVTGDHKVTGQAIAAELGIAGQADAALDGKELEALSDAALAERIDSVRVFARVQPAQKLRIVDAYQRRGEVVAMTGDGVNDAPALVKADVGVAMGRSGTEVAKEAAKIVLADDNFATIVAAVEEGRVVYRNIKKAVLLLFSTSAAEVLVLLIAMVAGFPPPFAAVQILWNNLVTEGLITVNLIMEPAEGDEMRRRPIPPDEPLLTRTLLTRIAFMTPAIVASTLGWFMYRTWSGVPAAQVQSEAFTLLALCEWFNVLNCRSEWRSALNLTVFTNRWLVGGLIVGNLLQLTVIFWGPVGRIFHTVPFELPTAIALGAVASLVLWVEEARKWFVRRRERAVAQPLASKA